MTIRIARKCRSWLVMALIVSLPSLPAPAQSPSGLPNVARIDSFVTDQVRRHGIPGVAMALVDGDHIVLVRGYGKADQTGRSVTPETPFILASVSKPLTALAIMQLAEAGKLELDAPVQRYLPAFALADPIASKAITIRQLLLHTSGIPVTACDTRTDAETLEQFVAELKTAVPHAPPGTRHNYCSGNYNVLGRIIEVVSGESFAAYMRGHVFAPLDMRHSFAREAEARRAGLAQGYQWLFGVPVAMSYRFNPSQLPSGYLMSSAEDMAHFLIAELNGGKYGSAAVLSPTGVSATHAPGVPRGDGKSTYDLGWVSGSFGGVPAVYHDGVNFAFHSLVLTLPEARRGVVLLMNSFGMVPYAGAYKEIETGVTRLLAGLEPAPPSMTLGRRYAIIDIVLIGVFALVLWPLLLLRWWPETLGADQKNGRRRRLGRIGLRLVWELGFPIALLLGVRLLIGAALGAQSWGEILSVFPDFGAWLWAIAVVMFATGVVRLALLQGVIKQSRSNL